jgi:two-component system NarL family response regulator
MAESGGAPRVVVIDGDGDVRDLLEMMLEMADGFRLVHVAVDAERGVRQVAALQPDAVVYDLDLPDIDGIQAIARLRAASPRSRLIVISAFPDPMTLLEVLRQGADEYLDKSRVWADLLPVIELLCRDDEVTNRSSDRGH